MFNLKTFLFFLISIFGICLSTYLYEEYGRVESVSVNKKQIGYFNEITNTVYQKFNHKFLWLESKTGQVIYESQAIKTDKNSTTRIILKNGSIIDLKENSMVVLSMESNQLSLNVLSGDFLLKVKENEKLKVANGNQTIEVKNNSTVHLSRKESKSLIQVLEGSVQIGKDYIDSGKTVESVKNEPLLIKENTFKDISPEIGSFKTFNERIVSFYWKKNNKNKTKLLIGKNSENLEEIELSTNAYSSKFTEGIYFWKLKDSTEETPVFSFKVEKLKRSNLIYPTKDLILFENPSKISFKVESFDSIESKIEVSKDKTFKSILNLNEFFEKGTYYWRVKDSYLDESIYSDPISFQVEDKPKNVEISFISKKEEIYLEKPRFELKWDSTNQGAVSKWVVEIKKDDFYKKIQTTTPELVLTELNGDFKIKVKGFDRYENTLGEKEEMFTLTKAPEAQIPYIESYRSDSNGNVSINYRNDYESCEILILSNNFKTSCNSTIKDLLPGNYPIKVIAKDRFGRTLESRNPASIIVPLESSIKAPKKRKVKVNTDE